MEVPWQYNNKMSSTLKNGTTTVDEEQPKLGTKPLHIVRRGVDATGHSDKDIADIQGYSSSRMAARTPLSATEEKKLPRSIDWHIMPLCSIMFLLKNLDADNISNARIMNKGTDQNIMTQLGMSSDAYTLLTVLYYIPYIVLEAPSNLLLQRFQTKCLAESDYVDLGYCALLSCGVQR